MYSYDNNKYIMYILSHNITLNIYSSISHVKMISNNIHNGVIYVSILIHEGVCTWLQQIENVLYVPALRNIIAALVSVIISSTSKWQCNQSSHKFTHLFVCTLQQIELVIYVCIHPVSPMYIPSHENKIKQIPFLDLGPIKYLVLSSIFHRNF